MLFARVKIGVTKFPTKTTKKDENFFLCPRFFSKVGAHPFKMSFFSAKRQTFGGGYNFKTGYWLASDHPGAYTCMP
mgnify:FL=1